MYKKDFKLKSVIVTLVDVIKEVEMEIEILEFIPNRKGMRIGYVDFKVTYSPEKDETFKQVAYFEKENRKWLSVGAVERDGKWVDRYARTPSLKNLFHQVTEKLGPYIKSKSAIGEENNVWI